MPYANIGDTKLYYQIYGNELEFTQDRIYQKPTLVVLHGGPGVDHTFEVEFSKECASFAQVILFDQRGNGRSIDNNANHWNLKQWARDVHSFCEALGLSKPFLQGVSMGGWVLMQFAIDYPDYAGGIILLDTEAFMDIENICKAFEKRAGKEIAHIARQYLQKDACIPQIFQQFFSECAPLCSINPIPETYFKRAIIKPEVNAHMQIERATFNYLDDLHKIKNRILYLTNTINPFHLLSSAKTTAKSMTHADVTFVSFANCGLVQLDAKEQSINEITKFLKRA